jgi:uncharacterized membrane protein
MSWTCFGWSDFGADDPNLLRFPEKSRFSHMTARQAVLTYGLSLVLFLAVDLAWIGFVANRFYTKHLGHLLRPDVQWVPAIVFYLLFVAAVVVFAVIPGLTRGAPIHTALLAGFLGLVAYATYDLTNLALMKDFPLIVAVVDIVWGATVAIAVGLGGYGFARWVGA